MDTTTTYRALSYHDPSITTILTLTAFILSANAINYALDKLMFCGLVGQIFVGIAFGTPGLQWLPPDCQDVVTQLGYLGLILIVFEGGLSTNVRTLRANLFLSSLVAITGVALPIALSYILQSMLGVTALQAFVAGAALCSTSLGTTFTVLQTSGLSRSRLGIVLAGAAMMDDVVGLVLVQIVSTLGQQPTIEASTIVRPIGVSLAYAVVTPAVCKYLVRPVRARLQRMIVPDRIAALLDHPFWVSTAVLVAFVASASFAGTSNLFAAYLAGACITWWDDETPVGEVVATQKIAQDRRTDDNNISSSVAETRRPSMPSSVQHVDSGAQYPTVGQHLACASGLQVYRTHYAPAVDTLLRPFFFASIGFSIPIAQMFDGHVVWRGVVYTMLMMLGKMACGLWLSGTSPKLQFLSTSWLSSRLAILHRLLARKGRPVQPSSTTPLQRDSQNVESEGVSGTIRFASPNEATERPAKKVDQPHSLYPGAILGMAMVSRGEIGFLVSAVAQSRGLYTTANGEMQLFLVVTWAIMLCTIAGPIATGLLVKRVWRLQKAERNTNTGRQDPLGVWGAR